MACRRSRLDQPGNTVGRYSSVGLSPDGKRLALVVDDGAGTHLSLYELARDRMSRLAEFKDSIDFVVWTPDTKHLVFHSDASQLAGPGIYWMRADGAGEPQRLMDGSGWLPESFYAGWKAFGLLARRASLWALDPSPGPNRS